MAKTTVSEDPIDVAAAVSVDEPHHAGGGDPGPTAPNGRRRALTRAVIATAIGLSAVIVIRSFVVDSNGASSPAGSSEHLVTDIPAPRGPKTPVESLVAPVLAPQRPQTTPVAAVSAYLSAEINLDFEASFALLDEGDRTKVGDVTAWSAKQPERPTYRSFSVVGTSATGVVTTTVELVPRLDETVGFVPASAQVGWVTTPGPGGFTVAASKADVAPVLPADVGSTSAAIDWANSVAAGIPAGDRQYGGSLLGQPELVDQLSKLGGGNFRAVGAPTSIEDWPSVATITNAFGAGASEWARVVSLAGPKGLDVVVAPLGDRWQVVGVVAT